MSQSILHSNTVWGVGALPDGDVATACADGQVRIWTTNPGRMASDDLKAKQSNEAMAQAAEASRQGAGAVPLDSVPDFETVGKTTPGKKMGEIKMFKVGTTINAYSWNGGAWDLVGEVTGKPKSKYEGDQ